MSDQIDYRAVRRRAEAALQKDKRTVRVVFLVITVVMYIVFMVMAWWMFINGGGAAPGLAELTNGLGFDGGENSLTGAMVLMSVGWGMAVLYQFILMFIDTKAGARQMRERAYGRELARELETLGAADDDPEVKRKRITRLTDDGELETIDDADDSMDNSNIARSS